MDKDQIKSLISVILLVIFTIGVVVYSKVSNNNSKKIDSTTEIVTDYSEFYTVNSCVNNVINYISEKKSDNLYLLISDNYKKNNKVTEENVLSLFENLSGTYVFTSKKMYYQNINDEIKKYYVSGYIKSNDFSEEYIKINKSNIMYIIVYLDSNNGIYSIEPYDGKIFIEGENND